MHVKTLLSQAALGGALLFATGMPATANEGSQSGFFVQPEVVYFSFTETDFNYATVGPFLADELDGHVSRVDNDYDLGWRLGFGYRWDNDWDFTARWTHIDTKSESHTQASGGDYLFLDHDPFEWYDYWEDGYAEAEADQSLDYVDLTVGRTFKSEKGHWVRAYAGLRWASFDQSFDVLYVDNDDSDPDVDDDAYSSWMDSDYTGWGFTLGGEGHLALGEKKEWSLFGSLGVSVLMGDTDQKRFDADWFYEDYPTKADAFSVAIDTHDSFDSTSTVIEAQLGVDWTRQFEDVKFHIRWGWEIQHWTGIGTLTHWVGYDQQSGRADGDGDIGVMGAFVRAGWAW